MQKFPFETVIQLLKEAGVDLPADVSAIVKGKSQKVAAPDADNLDLVNMPATFDGGWGSEGGDNVTGVNMPLTAIQKKAKKLLQNKNTRSPSHNAKSSRVGTSYSNRDRTTRHLENLSQF